MALNTNMQRLTRAAIREAGMPYHGRNAEGAPPHAVQALVDELLGDAFLQHASDLHFESREDGLHIRLRIDGLLEESAPPLPAVLAGPLLSRVRILAGMDITNHLTPVEGHIRASKVYPDIRVSSIPAIDGESMVLRFMTGSDRALSLEELGYLPDALKRFRTLIHRPQGLILIVGPMGSGKSSTLYAAIEELKDPSKSILTLEDPVERILDGITQIEINAQTGLTFPVGLRALLRQDCQCVLLGEIRDEETAHLAVRVALTGHLVLATLHTSDCISTIFRLLEMGVPRYLLAATLTGIVSQRLVRKLKKDAPDGTGCRYQGRTVISEVLPFSLECRQLLLEQAPASAFRQYQKEAALPTLMQDGLEKCRLHITDEREICRVLGLCANQ
ncbi:MAG: GspE/PulE family protein [Selenomonadaceae bacterium]|nr:GspE/PulE family protein [Selenomonadaceae bacterium]